MNECTLKILVACEESQTICKAFRELGHEAYSCDLMECSGGHPEWHICGDALKEIEKNWDLIIAHPPCYYMSKAGARWMFPGGKLNEERYEKAIGLPEPSQVIQPYEYGDPYSKRTLLWLKNLPCLKPTKILENHVPWMPSNTGGFSRGKGGSRGIAHDKKTASKTFEGIAKAIAEQWSEYLIKEKEKDSELK